MTRGQVQDTLTLFFENAGRKKQEEMKSAPINHTRIQVNNQNGALYIKNVEYNNGGTSVPKRKKYKSSP